MKESESERTRRRWITVGELIALAALIVSALGVWISWKSRDEGPTRVVEQHQPIPLTLRATRGDDGRRLEISPVEDSHALQSLTVTVPFATFNDWWEPYTLGVGPAGAYVAQLDEARRDGLRDRCARLLPASPFKIVASAWCVRARA